MKIMSKKICFNGNRRQDVINLYCFRKKFQTCIPEEFETFQFTRAAVDALDKTEEFKSEFHYRAYYCLLKKMIKIKIYEKCSFFICNK